MTTQTYQQASQRFLAQAQAELAAGDLQQASEKGWGAVAQMLKAIANQRGWEHERHRHLSRAASRLRAETGDRDLYRFFSVANDLHGNFYENEMSAQDIADGLDDRRSSARKASPDVGPNVILDPPDIARLAKPAGYRAHRNAGSVTSPPPIVPNA